MNIRDIALQIATQAHAGQFDKAGVEYIQHPLHVAAGFSDDVLYATAMLHDVAEDTELSLDDLRNCDIPETVIAAIDAITKRPGEGYLDYLDRVKANSIAHKVKLADIRHNMDLNRIPEPTERDIARCEKYKQAIKYLAD